MLPSATSFSVPSAPALTLFAAQSVREKNLTLQRGCTFHGASYFLSSDDNNIRARLQFSLQSNREEAWRFFAPTRSCEPAIRSVP